MQKTQAVGEISGYQRRLEQVLAGLYHSLKKLLSYNEELLLLQVASLSKQLLHFFYFAGLELFELIYCLCRW